MTDEELEELLTYCQEILPGGNEEARQEFLEDTYGDFGRNDLNGD